MKHTDNTSYLLQLTQLNTWIIELKTERHFIPGDEMELQLLAEICVCQEEKALNENKLQQLT